MKKIFLFVAIILLGGFLVSCTTKDEDNTINVAVSFYPMDAILDLIKEDVKADGYELTYHNFTGDHVKPNLELQAKNFDANMMQHEFFMESFNKGNNGSLVHSMNIYHAIFGLYSVNNTQPADIEQGATVAIPNDADNLGRALLLLRDAGLITFNSDDIVIPKISDIKTNPKELKFVELALPAMVNSYGKDINYAVNYPTYMKSLNLEGNDQRVFTEDFNLERVQKFAISLIVREDNKDSKKIEVLKKHLNSDKVRNLLKENYGWASTPAF